MLELEARVEGWSSLLALGCALAGGAGPRARGGARLWGFGQPFGNKGANTYLSASPGRGPHQKIIALAEVCMSCVSYNFVEM